MVQSSTGARGQAVGARAVPRPRARRQPQVSSVVVSVRLTAQEAQAVDAARGAQSRADWVRSKALGSAG